MRPPETISNKCLYALRAVFELALRRSDAPVTAREAAAAQGIPRRFLEVILSDLRQGGLLESRRGNRGGYILARPAPRITIGDVIELVQGKGAGDPARPEQDATAESAFGEVWEQVHSALSGIYNSTTFADLVEKELATRTPYVANYVI